MKHYLLLMLAATMVVLAGCEKAKQELHIYTWSDYIAPQVIESFEANYNCRIIVDTFDSNEAMYAKLKAGGTGYDILMPSSYLVSLMAKEGLIQKLDHSKMPFVRANFDERFQHQILDPDFVYNVPYAVTYTGFMYCKDKIPEGLALDSWTALEHPALKGKVTLLDDIREVVGAGLMANGFSVSSTNPMEINQAVETVLKWRKNIRKFDAESYKTEVATGAIWVGQGYSTDVMQVIVGDEDAGIDPRPDIGFALPKEGFSIAFDEMVLAANAPNPDLAYKFMNYLYHGQVACVNMEYILGPMPVRPGLNELPQELREVLILSDDVMSRGQVIAPVSDAAMSLYNKAWDRIKATDAK